MTDTTVATLSVPIIGDPKQLDAALARAERRLQQFQRQFGDGLPVPKGGGGGGGGDPFAPTTRSSQQARDSVLAQAQALARLKTTEGDAAEGARILAAALNDTNRGTLQGIGAQTQLAGINNRIAKEASGAGSAFERMSGGISTLNTAIGALGLAGLAAGVVSAGVAAAQSANELERTQAIMRQLSGTSERYAEIVKLAEGNQRLFGGSLNSNLTPLNALLQLSNRTGAELANLNETSQLLLASAPAKAFEDASFALSEFLSNNGAEAALSLADQFNLNKQALAELAAEGTTASERIAGLNALLAEQGVTAATLAAATSTNAATYAATGAAVDTLRTQLGALLAEGFAPVAAGVGDATTAVSGFIVSLTGADSPIAQFQARLAETSGSYEEYRARAEASAAGTRVMLDGLIAGIPLLAPFSDQLAALAANMGILTKGEYEAAAGAEVQAAATQGATITVETQAEAQARLAAETQAATEATQAATAASNADAVEKLAEAAAAEQAGQQHAALEAAIRSAAAGSESAAVAAARIAGVFTGVEAPAIAQLIGLYRELNATKAAATGTKTNNVPANKRIYQSTGVPADVLRSQKASAESAERMRAAEEARRQQLITTGSATQVATLRQEEYTAAVKQYGADSAQAIQAETRLMQAREAAQRDAAKGAKGAKGGGGKSEAEKASEKEVKEAERLKERLRDIDERYYDQAADAEQRYQERRLSIQQQFAEKRAEAEEAYSDQQVESRLDFYKSLKGIDDQAIRQQASAEFEQFAQKANELRDTKGADVAAKYEAEAAAIAAARAQRAEEIKKAEEDAKKDRSKSGDAQYLRDLDKMERDAEQRRLDRAAEGKGSLAEDEAAAVADADQQRQEALAEAATTAGKAMAEAQGIVEERALATNTALADQVALLDQIRQRGGLPGAGTAPPPAAPAATAPATPEAASATPAPAATGGPLPVEDAALRTAVEALRRSTDAVERAMRRFGDRPNTSPGG